LREWLPKSKHAEIKKPGERPQRYGKLPALLRRRMGKWGKRKVGAKRKVRCFVENSVTKLIGARREHNGEECAWEPGIQTTHGDATNGARRNLLKGKKDR